MVFAEASGLETKSEFSIRALNSGGTKDGGEAEVDSEPPANKPVRFPTQRNAQITARDQVYSALAKAKERNIEFTEVILRIQEGAAYGQFGLAGQSSSAARVQQALEILAGDFSPLTPVTMQFRAQFPAGQDLIDFATSLDLPYRGEWEEIE